MAYTLDSMPTWLDVVQRARQEMGVSGGTTSPTTVVAQSGELKRVVDWTTSAYNAICKSQRWGWLFTNLSKALTAGDRTKDPRADWTIVVREWDMESFQLYVTATGISDAQWLRYLPWEYFRPIYNIRTPSTQRPMQFTFKPDGKFMFETTTDVNYTLLADYYAGVDIMNADADVPLIPDDFRMLIVWEAVKLYCGYETDTTMYSHAEAQSKKLYNDMAKIWLPADEPDDPLV